MASPLPRLVQRSVENSGAEHADNLRGKAMNAYSIRRAPWTCEWGRFGVVVEDLAVQGSRVDDVFWACHHPSRAPDVRMTRRGECEDCPFWIEAARFRVAC
jgi:hypothetical protein